MNHPERKSDTYQDHTSIELHHGKLLIQLNTSLPRVADDASPGEKLWYYRELRGMTREELGEEIGLRAGGVQNLEGCNNVIHYYTALKIGEILDIDPNTLLDEHTRFCGPGCGDRVKQIRFAWKMTQEAFSDLMGIDRSSLARWEVDYGDIHLNRTMYYRLKELAVEKGMDMETLITDPYAYDDGYDRFICKDCGRKIRYVRAAYGIYESEFAVMAGCEAGSAVANWENGNTIPLRDKYYRIRDLALQKNIDIDILNEDPEAYKSAYLRFIERDPGKKIRYIRLTCNLFQEQFGEQLGCSGNTVSEWESEHCILGQQFFDRLERLAAEHRIDLQALNDDPSIYYDEFSEFCSSDCSGKIRRIRAACGASVAELARFINVSSTAVCQWENEEKNRCPSRRSFAKIKEFAALRGVNINDT